MEVKPPTLAFLLHDVARLLKKRLEQNSGGSGLTRSQWQILAYLAQNEGINQKGLAELLHLVEAARPKLEQIRELGDVTHREALAGVSEDEGQCLLRTLEAMKANLTEACEAPTAGQKRASHG